MSRQLEKMQHSKSEASGLHVWLVLWKAFTAMQERALTDIEQLGLGLSDFAILELLLHKGALPVNEIGAKVKLTSGSMSTAIDRLERRNLVERRKLTADARCRMVHLTEAGLRFIEPAFRQHEKAMNCLGQVLEEGERAELIRLLKKLGKAAEGADNPAPPNKSD